MAVCITTFRTVAGSFTAPHACLGRINNLLVRDSSPEMFVTAFYAILNIRTGELRYCNGGHNLPYLVRADGSVTELEQTVGILLGMFEDFTFSHNTITLGPGDKLFMYTDGVTEAMNERSEFYDEARLELQLTSHGSQNAGALLRKIRESISEFTADAEQSDDITMMMLEYHGNRAGEQQGIA